MVVGTGYFRQQGQGNGNGNDPRNDRFYVPIALAVPGFAVPVAEKATEVQLDVKGEVRDEQGRVVGRIRETMKVPSGGAETLAGRQVFYQTGLSLPPGRFVVKVVLRENTGGGIGSFEAANRGAADERPSDEGELGRDEHAGAEGRDRTHRQSAGP